MKKYAALIFFIYGYAAICTAVYSQNTGAYIIPRRIFIGDPAVFVLPLPGTAGGSSDIVLTELSANFPSHTDIDFHRIVLERRTSGSRLMIEFTAFVPGLLEFPAIEIGGDRFAGLTVTVDSIINNRSTPVLSGPASSLAMPGTAVMLYGIMAALIIVILLAIWFVLKGRIFLNKLNKKLIYWNLFISMKVTEKHLKNSVLNGEDKRLILDKISDEFRNFLSYLTGSNCRAMTASEFERLHLKLFVTENLNKSILQNFFNKCDELRFSGNDVNTKEILRLLAWMRSILAVLEKTKPERIKLEKKRAAA